MALSSMILAGLLAMAPGNPLGDLPAYWEAMETAQDREMAAEQVADVLTRHVRVFNETRRAATKGATLGGGKIQVRDIHIDGDKASAIVSLSDRSEFVQLVRFNRRWTVVVPERERRDP
jgi:hypothetical protein